MADRTAVAESVARACTASAGTVQALAEEVGVSYAALCSWSRGRRQPPPHRLSTLADVLDRRAERLRALANELRGHAGETETGIQAVPFRAPISGIRAEPAPRSWAAAGSDRSRTPPLSAR
jgi:DNA-binding transcriptional regulator YdaS (Cro superfamily)